MPLVYLYLYLEENYKGHSISLHYNVHDPALELEKRKSDEIFEGNTKEILEFLVKLVQNNQDMLVSLKYNIASFTQDDMLIDFLALIMDMQKIIRQLLKEDKSAEFYLKYMNYYETILQTIVDLESLRFLDIELINTLSQNLINGFSLYAYKILIEGAKPDHFKCVQCEKSVYTSDMALIEFGQLPVTYCQDDLNYSQYLEKYISVPPEQTFNTSLDMQFNSVESTVK